MKHCEKPKVTHKYLVENVRYDESTGELWWKKYIPHRRMDRPIGTNGSYGYLVVNITRKSYAVHRLIWFFVYGRWPNEVDHINGDRKDNRINNLREVTRHENASNRHLSSNNTSGHCGVWFNAHPKVRMWYAGIKTGGKTIHLGAFKNKDDAIEARKRAEKQYPVFTSRHGTPKDDA